MGTFKVERQPSKGGTMLRKLLFLTLALAATAGLSLTDVRPAEAACKKICCPGGFCVTCCQAPCPTIVCPP
jgi:hypothetical protein